MSLLLIHTPVREYHSQVRTELLQQTSVSHPCQRFNPLFFFIDTDSRQDIHIPGISMDNISNSSGSVGLLVKEEIGST